MKRGFSPECVCPPSRLFVFILYTSLYLRSIVASPRPTRAFRLSPGVTELVLGRTNAPGEGRGMWRQHSVGESSGLSSESLVRMNRASALRQRRTKMRTESRVHTGRASRPARCPPAKYSRALAHARTRTHLRGGVWFCCATLNLFQKR